MLTYFNATCLRNLILNILVSPSESVTVMNHIFTLIIFHFFIFQQILYIKRKDWMEMQDFQLRRKVQTKKMYIQSLLILLILYENPFPNIDLNSIDLKISLEIQNA